MAILDADDCPDCCSLPHSEKPSVSCCCCANAEDGLPESSILGVTWKLERYFPASVFNKCYGIVLVLCTGYSGNHDLVPYMQPMGHDHDYPVGVENMGLLANNHSSCMQGFPLGQALVFVVINVGYCIHDSGGLCLHTVMYYFVCNLCF